tara:strand:- start:5 stop:721 length:717 start_codon:yes stop_codon:yes gene_type:complete
MRALLSMGLVLSILLSNVVFAGNSSQALEKVNERTLNKKKKVEIKKFNEKISKETSKTLQLFLENYRAKILKIMSLDGFSDPKQIELQFALFEKSYDLLEQEIERALVRHRKNIKGYKNLGIDQFEYLKALGAEYENHYNKLNDLFFPVEQNKNLDETELLESPYRTLSLNHQTLDELEVKGHLIEIFAIERFFVEHGNQLERKFARNAIFGMAGFITFGALIPACESSVKMSRLKVQ